MSALLFFSRKQPTQIVLCILRRSCMPAESLYLSSVACLRLSCFRIAISVFFFNGPFFSFSFCVHFHSPPSPPSLPFALAPALASALSTRIALVRTCPLVPPTCLAHPPQRQQQQTANSQQRSVPFAMDSKSQVGSRDRARTHCSDAGKRTREDALRTAHV